MKQTSQCRLNKVEHFRIEFDRNDIKEYHDDTWKYSIEHNLPVNIINELHITSPKGNFKYYIDYSRFLFDKIPVLPFVVEADVTTFVKYLDK